MAKTTRTVEPEWLSPSAVLAVHDVQIAEHGGGTGLRDASLLDSALAKPRQHWAYAKPSIPELAAQYCFGIVRNHPFVDGNKRTGYVAANLFLELNRFRMTAPDEEVVLTIVALAAAKMTIAQLETWFVKHSQARR